MTRLALALVALLVAAVPVTAQQGDPVEDLLRRVVNDVNDLRYADALRAGRELLGAGSLRAAQEVRLRLALAAAHFPEDGGTPLPDSAVAQFERVLQLAPDAELPVVLAWPGLDSLLRVARQRVLTLAVRGAADSLAVGREGVTLTLVTSRDVHLRLSTRRRDGRIEVLHDEAATSSRRAVLTLYALRDGIPLLAAGEHELTIAATDPLRGDTARLVRRILVEGAPPALEPTPVLDSTRLVPERVPAARGRVALSGAAFALATVGVSAALRGGGEISRVRGADARAMLVGGGIVAATTWAVSRETTGTDERAVRANADLVAEHQRATARVSASNARLLNAYRVTVRWQPEAP